MALNGAQENMSEVMTAPLSPAFLARLRGLPPELRVKILVFMTMQNVEQLQAIRLSSRSFNADVLIHQRDIVHGALNSSRNFFRTADRLYDGLSPAVHDNLNYLFCTSRRCDLAKQLAVTLAPQLLPTHSSNRGGCRASSICSNRTLCSRIIRNITPYILALASVFEHNRNRLECHQSSGPFQPTDDAETAALPSRFNEETVERLCALYRILMHRRTLITELEDGPGSDTHMRQHLQRPFPIDQGCVDMFVFGGLEAVNDVIAQTEPRGCGRHCGEIVKDHFARACPCVLNRVHNLPPSTLPTPTRGFTRLICAQLPPALRPIDDSPSKRSHRRRQTLDKKEEARFREHLVTFEGEESELAL